MTDTYTILKKELKVLNPDITDKELNNMALNMVNFFTLATKIFQESQELSSPDEKKLTDWKVSKILAKKR